MVIDRLISRHHHFLAIRICEYLAMKPDPVLIHWACAKVKTKSPDQMIHDIVVAKLARAPGISYAEIASTAYKHGRRALATMAASNHPSPLIYFFV